MQSQSCAANSLYTFYGQEQAQEHDCDCSGPFFYDPREIPGMLVAALLAAAAVANVIPSAESQWLHDSTLPLRGGVGHGVVEQVVTDCAETAARNAGAFKGQAQLAIIGCRPSLARFRMPFRTVEALDDGCYSASRQLLTIRLHERRTCAVATSLRSQHRPRPRANSCHPAGDAQLVENDEGGGERCVLCNQEFHPLSADASSQSRSTAFRAQLRTCGHVFCSACVAQVLVHQGKSCNDICSSAGTCAGCLSGVSLPGPETACRGWAPCPFCRRLYCQDEVLLLQGQPVQHGVLRDRTADGPPKAQGVNKVQGMLDHSKRQARMASKRQGHPRGGAVHIHVQKCEVIESHLGD